MRHILFLLFMAFTLQAIAQYPATGNKMRLGWQTTGDGLVYRGAIGDTATLDPSGINNAWMLLDTANGNLYAYRAKAWRLVSGGGGGGGLTMPFDSVTFNVNETDASLRELKYSEEKGYLQYGGQDSVQIPLLPGIWYVRNDTSVTIPKGTVLRATGTLGASGRIKVKHMIANGSIDAMYILGIAMQDIAVGADGYAMSQGKIRKINTQAYSEGSVLYADVDTLGGLTQTKPTGSNLKLPIAFVVHSASNGTLAVRVTSGAYMRDLHDAEITSPVSNASLYYNAAQGVWRDTGAAVLVADTAAMLTNYINVVDTATMLSSYISNADTSAMLNSYAKGSSAADRIAYWNGTRNITGSSLLRHTSNNRMVIGTLNAPTGRVHIRSENNTPNLIIDSYNNETSGSIVFTGGDNAFFSSEESFFINIDADNNQTTRQFGVLKNSYGSIGSQQILSVRELDNSLIIFNGNIAINTTSPQRNLHVTGDARITNLKPAASPRNIVGSSSTGDLTTLAWGNGLTVTLADTILRVDTSVILPKVNVSGTTNRLAMFTAGNRVGNSIVTQNGRSMYINSTQDNSGYSYSNAFQFNGFGSGVFDQPVLGIIGNVGTTANRRPYISMYRSAGSTVNDKTLVPYNYYLGSITWQGADGTDFQPRGAEITAITDSITGSNDMPTALFFGTTANGQEQPTERMRITSAGNVGIATASPSRPLHVAGTTAIRIPVGNFAQRGTSGAGDIRVRNDTANLEFHNGTSWQTVATQSYVTDNAISTVYIPINLYAPGDTVANTTNSKAFFLVHSGLNGYCIDSYTVKAISGSGTADIQIDKNGTGGNLQAISGTTTATKDTNIALATGDYIRGQVFNLSGTLVGLGLTLEIKKTCN